MLYRSAPPSGLSLPVFFLLPLLAWVIPLLLISLNDPAVAAYRDNILLRQKVVRYSNPWGHFNPPWYYIARVIPLNWMSLSPLILFALPEWWRRSRAEPRFWLPLAWIVVILVFFSVTPGKRDIYIYPALPLMALALAPLFDSLVRRPAVQWVYFALGSLLTLALIAVWAATMDWIPFQNSFELLLTAFTTMFIWIVAAALITGTVFRRRRAYLWLSSILLIIWFAYRLMATPILNDLRSSRGLLSEVIERVGLQGELGIAGWWEQTLLQARLLRPGGGRPFSGRLRRERTTGRLHLTGCKQVQPGGGCLLLKTFLPACAKSM